jgi:hypothetical protein
MLAEVVDAVLTGTLTTQTANLPGNTLEIQLGRGHTTLLLTTVGGATCTMVFEASSDGGTTYVGVSGLQLGATPSVVTSGGNTTAAIWMFSVGGFQTFRARCTAFTSAPTLRLQASVGFQPGLTITGTTGPSSGATALGALNANVTLPLGGYSGVSIVIAAGLVGTITPQFSFDNGVTYNGDSANPPFIMSLTGASSTGTLAVPFGATHVRAIVTAYTSGANTVTLLAVNSGSAPARAACTGPLAAATATVITAGAAQTATGNEINMPIDASKWSSAFMTFTAAAFNGTLTWDMMIDGQWVTVYLAAATQPASGVPWATLTTTASGNPSVAGSIAYTTTAADVWELPLPANATQVRVRCALFTSGTITVTLTAGRPLNPGTPVLAVLCDVTSASNTATDTGNMNTAGWETLNYDFSMTGGVPAFTVLEVDDAGTALAALVTSATAFSGGIGQGSTVGGTAGLSAASAQIPLFRRTALRSAAIAAQTSRTRATARRNL